MDFVLRCAEHEVLQKFPNTGLDYSYRIPGHCSTREQRSIYRPLNAKRAYVDICPFRGVFIFATNTTPSLIPWVAIYKILYHLRDRFGHMSFQTLPKGPIFRYAFLKKTQS